MQDIHTLGGVGGGGGGGVRLFTGGGVGGDRRLRPHSHQNHQQLKCPRCDSVNTKFCYYNNYNLSQPRHFCKNCRRYWTKGGVLRNVPVGGGCRKSKRSPKPKSAAGTTTSSDATDAANDEQNSNSNSSSESSSLTTTTTAAPMANTTSVAGTGADLPSSATASSSNSAPSKVLSFPDSSSFFMLQNGGNPSFDHQPLAEHHHTPSGGQFFSFSNMMTSSNEPAFMGFNAVDIPEYHNQHAPVVDDQSSNQQQKTAGSTTPDQLKMQDMVATGFLDPAVEHDLTALQQQSRGSNGGLAALNWENDGGGQGGNGGDELRLFDYTSAVDQAYWSQNHWASDIDHSLNFLP